MLRILTATSVIAALILSGCATQTIDTASNQSRAKTVTKTAGSAKVAYAGAGGVRLKKIVKAAEERKDVLFPTDPRQASRPEERAVLFPSDPNAKVRKGEETKQVLIPGTSGTKRYVTRRIVRNGKVVRTERVIRVSAASVPAKVRTYSTKKSARIYKNRKVRGAFTVASVSRSGGAYQSSVTRFARAYGVPVSLAHAIVRVESGYRVNARGGAGEIGLMQIKPSTARMMGYRGSARGLYNPETNLKYGMKYLAQAHRLGGGSVCGTVLKYNAGHGARRMNPISARYCSRVKRIIRS
jgi:SLT domain-containing protein